MILQPNKGQSGSILFWLSDQTKNGVTLISNKMVTSPRDDEVSTFI
jgi:hypothetical protein